MFLLLFCFVSLHFRENKAFFSSAITFAHTDKSFMTVTGKVVHQWLTSTSAQSARIGGAVVNQVVARCS